MVVACEALLVSVFSAAQDFRGVFGLNSRASGVVNGWLAVSLAQGALRRLFCV